MVIKKQTNHMHNHFDVFFQQAASLHITEREDVPCDTWLGLAKPAGDAPVISLEGMGEGGDVPAGAHHYDKSMLLQIY